MQILQDMCFGQSMTISLNGRASYKYFVPLNTEKSQFFKLGHQTNMKHLQSDFDAHLLPVYQGLR